MVSNARLEVGTFVVNIGPHQWEFVDGHAYFGRTTNNTYGMVYRLAYGVSVRFREVRFVKIDTLMERLRHLAIVAVTSATPVKFTPDIADTATFWWVDWPTLTEMRRIVENRGELRVRLIEQSVGA
jgi:hypothetical protein